MFFYSPKEIVKEMNSYKIFGYERLRCSRMCIIKCELLGAFVTTGSFLLLSPIFFPSPLYSLFILVGLVFVLVWLDVEFRLFRRVRRWVRSVRERSGKLGLLGQGRMCGALGCTCRVGPHERRDGLLERWRLAPRILHSEIDARAVVMSRTSGGGGPLERWGRLHERPTGQSETLFFVSFWSDYISHFGHLSLTLNAIFLPLLSRNSLKHLKHLDSCKSWVKIINIFLQILKI